MVYLVVMPLYCIMAVGLLVGGAVEHNGTAPFVTGVVMTPIAGAALLALLRRTLRPAVLDNIALRLPGGFGTKRVLVGDIAGVGLLYRVPSGGRFPMGWYTQVWDKNGHLYALDKSVVTSTRAERRTQGPLTRQKGRFVWERDWSLPLPHEDAEELASTRPGRAAKEIYDRVLELQGPTGPLALRELQKLTKAPAADYLGSVKAWWSPDGTMGRVLT